MAQDKIADAINMIYNGVRAKKKKVEIKFISRMLINILKIMRAEGAIKNYKVSVNKKTISVSIGNLVECKPIKPRFNVNKKNMDRYIRRYLPSRDLGTIIISTNEGLMTHREAIESGKGGVLIAYFW